ncbi:YdbL family protein [Methylomonas sp. SURF-2]|uniref:YdbL family protein n=1 Tax=Methylomonas subterranea TaxID=2952225 RepID=A0ABT1TG74_9GAMM|nr:YdbL family protein [Methylomonas sp. SURF-2]MCQ8104459.1 YdbL family protein [Methylomonas sp. SURF-2]
MKNNDAIKLLAALTFCLWFAITPVNAADLGQAKAAGLVGELMNGYLGLVDGNAPADVKALVDSINAQRRAEYQRIAAKNGVPAEEVAKLTAQKVIGQAAGGHFVQTPSGWKRR